MKYLISSALLALATATSVLAVEIPQDKVPEVKRTETQHYLLPKEVFDFKTSEGSKTLLVDVRTPAELQFVGFTDMMDGNVPYLTYDYSSWDDKAKEYKRSFSSGFVGQVEELMKKVGIEGKDARIILMCRSGDRSAKAADLMAKSGYTNVWSAIEGFEGDKQKDGPTKGQRTVNGWKNAGLPWTYNLNKDKAAYLD